MVYVLDKDGKPLMPTERHGKVRRMLKNGKAKVVRKNPFTIQLLYESTTYVQDVTLGVDAGSKHIGLSASTDKKELYVSDVQLRNDIVENLSTRREARSARRNRNTRYRKPRFQNRVKSKHKGWLAPSVEQKIECHMKQIADIHKILPVSKIIVETASFDIQKIKDPEISGACYQQGEQLGFWNVREYVLFRDEHKCQHCKGKSKDPILNVHHIESRKTGGNAPNNLITLCETCHNLAQRESYILHNQPLFSEEFHAWRFGPVLYEVRAMYANHTVQTPSSDMTDLDPDTVSLLENVFTEYAGKDCWSLARLTRAGFAWKQAREGVNEFANSETVVKKNDLRKEAVGEKLKRKQISYSNSLKKVKKAA